MTKPKTLCVAVALAALGLFLSGCSALTEVVKSLGSDPVAARAWTEPSLQTGWSPSLDFRPLPRPDASSYELDSVEVTVESRLLLKGGDKEAVVKAVEDAARKRWRLKRHKPASGRKPHYKIHVVQIDPQRDLQAGGASTLSMSQRLVFQQVVFSGLPAPIEAVAPASITDLATDEYEVLAFSVSVSCERGATGGAGPRPRSQRDWFAYVLRVRRGLTEHQRIGAVIALELGAKLLALRPVAPATDKPR